nr:FAD-binding domain-containing protein [uncultured Rhodoblastus sp.]
MGRRPGSDRPKRRCRRRRPTPDHCQTFALNELAGLPSNYIHRPWMAPTVLVAGASVKSRETYPAPLIDHDFNRCRALSAFAHISGGASS